MALRTVGGAAENAKDNTFRLQTGKTHYVQLAVTGGTLTCRVDGKALPSLNVSGANGLTGKVQIKTFELAAEMDDIQIRASK